MVCAGCAGVESVFACRECGREDHPYGGRRCARCFLRERLAVLLAAPATGQVHPRLRPVYDELVSVERPQSAVYWLCRKPGHGPRLLGQMARGEQPISHDTFRVLPSDKAHNYLRDLLVATGVLGSYEPRIERTERWLETKVEPLPAEHADIVRRFARWRVLRHLREVAAQGRMSKAIDDRAREQVRAAIRLLAYFDEHGATVQTATQTLLEHYQAAVGTQIVAEQAFVAWLHTSRINTGLTVSFRPWRLPNVTMSDQDRWQGVRRLLNDETLRSYTRIGGLFTLLFAQSLTRIVSMRTSQVTLSADGVTVAFSDLPIPMPPILDDLIRDHLNDTGTSPYGRHNTDWLFPGGRPGRHLQTENIRKQLVEIGIAPLQSRKAALYQLAADTPAPILAELLGTSQKNAASWAGLAARDWTSYVASRAR